MVNEQGVVIGVNTFIVNGGEHGFFSLPVRYLAESLALWQQGKGRLAPAVRTAPLPFLRTRWRAVLPQLRSANRPA
ncbi:MAG: hypothetical protein IPM82_21835 [Saprospiraceae bacterium]|nr:hypothetical protein [Saprospiraceae bacterium]